MAGPPGTDPWKALRRLVCRDKAEKGKVRVADSKKVNQGERGLERLEQTVLTFWGAWQGSLPTTVGALLEGLDVDLGVLAECPWYRDLDVALPLRVDPGLLELQAHSLSKALAAKRLEILHIGAHVVDAKEFNESIDDTNNKSRTHFLAYGRVLAQLLAILPDSASDSAHLVADRCGGITHYAGALRRAMPATKVAVVSERAQQSRYEITRDQGCVKVTFAVQGEDRSFPTALASCTAKYVREVMLHLLNSWFCERVPGLRRTAGYYTDGRRFVDEIGALLELGEFPEQLLIRSR